MKYERYNGLEGRPLRMQPKFVLPYVLSNDIIYYRKLLFGYRVIFYDLSSNSIACQSSNNIQRKILFLSNKIKESEYTATIFLNDWRRIYK